MLISDLFEGGNSETMRALVAELVRDGVTVLVLLALADDGVPAHDHHEAAALTALGGGGARLHPGRVPGAARRGARGPFVQPGCVPTLRSRNGVVVSIPGSLGRPSTRSPTMLRITSSLPPAIRMPGVPSTSWFQA